MIRKAGAGGPPSRSCSGPLIVLLTSSNGVTTGSPLGNDFVLCSPSSRQAALSLSAFLCSPSTRNWCFRVLLHVVHTHDLFYSSSMVELFSSISLDFEPNMLSIVDLRKQRTRVSGRVALKTAVSTTPTNPDRPSWTREGQMRLHSTGR